MGKLEGGSHRCFFCNRLFPDSVPIAVHACNSCMKERKIMNADEIYDLRVFRD